MLLAIDIGNTNINCGIFKEKALVKSFLIPTRQYALSKLKKRLGKFPIAAAIICSVVPRAGRRLEHDLEILLSRKPYNIGKLGVPIANRYRRPEQVGQDRLVNAYAGWKLYGAPLILVDFGTAVTFDIVSARGQYLGGLILPGLGISLDALAQKTALLPKIKPAKPKELIGRDTKSSMQSGIVYGFAAMTDGLIAKLQSKIAKPACVIATGGDASLIVAHCRRISVVDKTLTLKGLNLIYKTIE